MGAATRATGQRDIPNRGCLRRGERRRCRPRAAAESVGEAALDRRIAARAREEREEREEREQSSRDDETAKESKGSSRPQVAPDDELERWNRQIDERKRRWEAEHPKGEESEIEPPASAKKK